jgi:hypothetical protein
MILRLLIILFVSLVGAQAGHDISEHLPARSSKFWHDLDWKFFKFLFSNTDAKTEQERDLRLNFKDAWFTYLDYRLYEPYAVALIGPGSATYVDMRSTTLCTKQKEMDEVDFWQTKQLTPLIVRIWLVDADEPLWPGIKDCLCMMNSFGQIMTYIRDKTQIMQRPEIDPNSTFTVGRFEDDMKKWNLSFTEQGSVLFTEQEVIFLKKLDRIIQNELAKILAHFEGTDHQEGTVDHKFTVDLLFETYRRWNDYRSALIPFYRSILALMIVL